VDSSSLVVVICGQLPPQTLEDLIHGKPGIVEMFLHNLQHKMAKYKAAKEEGAQPEPRTYQGKGMPAGRSSSMSNNNYSDDDGGLPSPMSPSRVVSTPPRHHNIPQVS